MENIVDFANQIKTYMRGAEVVPSKNLLKNNLETGTFSGVTATHNADDSITLTNTATNNQWFGISAAGTINEFNVKLNANVTYVLSAGSNMPSGIALYGRDASENYLFRVESGASYAQYTPSNDIYINIACRVSNGTATGGFTIYPMLCTLEEWEKSNTYMPYYVPVKDSMFKRSEQRVLGAKNINTYPYSETTHTEADITFTVTDDGIVDIDGTSSGSTQFDFHRTGEFNNLKVGERYILSGAPDIEYLTEDVGLRLVIANDINTSQRQNIDCPQGGEIEFTIPTGWHFHWFTYRIASGKTFSHAKVKPMIRLASDPDDTYVPYAMTNKELTDVGFFLKEAIDSTMDLDNVKETGLYFISSSPTHAPENAAYCSLLVHARTTTDIRQIIFRYSDAAKCIYMRANGGSWTSWVKFTGTVVQ